MRLLDRAVTALAHPTTLGALGVILLGKAFESWAAQLGQVHEELGRIQAQAASLRVGAAATLDTSASSPTANGAAEDARAQVAAAGAGPEQGDGVSE